MGSSTSRKKIEFPTKIINIPINGTKENTFRKAPQVVGRSHLRHFSLTWENIGSHNAYCSIIYYEGIRMLNYINILKGDKDNTEIEVSEDGGCLMIITPNRTFKLYHQDHTVISDWQYTLSLILNHMWDFEEKIDGHPMYDSGIEIED